MLAAGEADGITRQGAGRGDRGRCLRLLLYGCQHLRGRDVPEGRRDEQGPYWLYQTQRASQQHGGVLAGGPVDAPLQVTN